MIRVIAAMDKYGVIGRGPDLPFRLKDDRLHFKANTIGRVVVMGRKTYESIGKPLPHRTNVVLTRSKAPIEGCYVMSSPEEVIKFFGKDFDVIGGGEIYRAFLDWGCVDELLITLVDMAVEGEDLIRFPKPHLTNYERKAPLFAIKANENNEADFEIYRYVRLQPCTSHRSPEH